MTTTDDPLLASILADPCDTARWLVYADMLEERGDTESAWRWRYAAECEPENSRKPLPTVMWWNGKCLRADPPKSILADAIFEKMKQVSGSPFQTIVCAGESNRCAYDLLARTVAAMG